MRRFLSSLRDQAYDVVYREGDTALQFLADLIRSPDEGRTEKYHSRELHRREKAGETPLTSEDKIIFQKILARHENEKVIDYWKRKKAFLAFPHKKDLVAQYRKLERRKERSDQLTASQEKREALQKLEEEFREITSLRYASQQTHWQR